VAADVAMNRRLCDQASRNAAMRALKACRLGKKHEDGSVSAKRRSACYATPSPPLLFCLKLAGGTIK